MEMICRNTVAHIQVFLKKDSSNSWGDRATKTENQRIFGDFDAFWIVIDLYDFNTVKEVGRDDLDMETQAVTWQSRLQTYNGLVVIL